MFIRKRQSSQHNASYQVIETYREGGKVKQRVLANLGPWPTLEEAVGHGRWNLAYMEGHADHCRADRARAQLARLEAVVSKLPHTSFSDTTARRIQAKYEAAVAELRSAMKDS
jgi:hypothetical protein